MNVNSEYVEDPINSINRVKFLTRVTQRKERDILFCYGNRMTKGSLSTVLNNNTANSQDAYFYISPSSKEEGVNYSTCHFVDLDAGRDKNMKYLSESRVRLIKTKMSKLINSCPLKPHYIVETRNGYQCYWLTDKTEYDSFNNKRMWSATQYYIKQYFKEYADERVGKINQIMRMPYTIWYKKEERKLPTVCGLIDNCGKTLRRYNKSLVYNKFKSVAANVFDSSVENTKTNNIKFTRFDKEGSYIWAQQNESKTEKEHTSDLPVKKDTFENLRNLLSNKDSWKKKQDPNVELTIKLLKMAIETLEKMNE